MRARAVLVAAGLAAFLVGETRHARINPRARWEKLAETARSPETQRSLSREAFAFDPDYGPFLEAVRRATPPGAAIALQAPATHELYTYEASYLLAPRRLVLPDRAGEAEYAAVFGDGAAPGQRIELPGVRGSLFRLR